MSGRLQPRGRRRLTVGAAALGLALAVAACGGSSSAKTSGSKTSGSLTTVGSTTINGAGSTFAAPMYQQWAGQYHQSVAHGVQINYQSVGSGGGISEFSQGVIDFGATDAPMSNTEQSAAQGGQGSVVLHLPMILGPVAIIYNEPGVPNLKLSGPVLADIYLGKVTHWNDPAIKRLNPGVTLPSDPIQPTERADSSGTSYVFTSYLSGVSPTWASQVAVSKSPSFPVGTGATGSSGIAASVQQTKGSIGYVEYGYAVQGHIASASLQNAAGQFVAPSSAGVEAAAGTASYPTDPAALKFSLVNLGGAASYPLSTPTYVLVAQTQRDKAKGAALKAWLEWALLPAQQGQVAKLGYAPLPSKLDSLVLAAVKTIH